MRNLKKILALVLALVMSLSLMATAGATEFPDDDKISDTYRTAAEVLTQLNVFAGDQNGNFNPTDNIRRSEVAAIIYRLATGDVGTEGHKTYAPYNQFPDINVEDWYAGYVTYCANAGYIKGRNTGKFDANDNVTGYEVLAMILRAVGYDKNNEFVGSNWQMNTASIARERGVLDNILKDATVRLSEPASRQVVAEMLFQASLLPQVTWNANTLSYREDGETLGKVNFGLEDVTGVVVANEWANLNTDTVLADGTTQMKLADNSIYTIDRSTELEAVGQEYTAYVADSTDGSATKRSLTLEPSGRSVVADNEGKSVNVASLRDSETHANKANDEGYTSIAALASSQGISSLGDAEYYLNYSLSYNDWETSEFLIRYAVAKVSVDGYTNTSGVGPNAIYGPDGNELPTSAGVPSWASYIQTLKNDNNKADVDKTYPGHSVEEREINVNWDANGDTTLDANDTITCYVVAISPEYQSGRNWIPSEINGTDIAIMRDIFYTADRLGGNTTGIATTQTQNYVYGEVYVGTSSMTDESDTLSWNQFQEKYFEKQDTVTYQGCGNGNSLRVIDTDGNGVADYIFKVTYAQDEAVGTYRNALEFYTLRPGTNAYWDGGADAYAVGDVVNYRTIDGKTTIWKAEKLTDVVNDKHFNNITVTLAADGDRGQSDITNNTGMDDNIMNMNDRVEYNIYLDQFGFIRTYELAQGSNYALVTEIYNTNNQAYNYVNTNTWIAEIKAGDADVEEYAVSNPGTAANRNPFITQYAWTTRNTRYYNGSDLNFMQPAIAHLGAIPNNALTVQYMGATTGTVPQYFQPVNGWNRGIFAMAPVTADGTNSLRTSGTDFGVFDYGTHDYTAGESYTTTNVPPAAGTAAGTFTFTNVAQYTMDGDSVALHTASQLATDRNGNQLYRVGYAYNSATGTATGTVAGSSVPNNTTGKQLVYGAVGTEAELKAMWIHDNTQANGIVTDTGATVAGSSTSTSSSAADIAIAANDWWSKNFSGSTTVNVAKNGTKIYPVYETDYIQLDLKAAVQGTTIGTSTRHYNIDANYNAYYNTNSNTYVNAVADTEFYVVMPDRVLYYESYATLPAIATANIRAAYAVATNTAMNTAGQDYWVADVIVIETTNLVSTYQSVSLMYYNPWINSTSVRYVNSLNNQWRTYEGVEDANVTVVPEWTDGGSYTWGNQSWQTGNTMATSDYGFYALYDTEYANGNLSAVDAVKITDHWNENHIFAGTIRRLTTNNPQYSLTASSYMDVDLQGRGAGLLNDDQYVIPVTIRDVPIYRVTSTSANQIRINNIGGGDVTVNDQIIWVTDMNGAVSYIIDLGARPLANYAAPAYLMNGTTGIYDLVIAEQGSRITADAPDPQALNLSVNLAAGETVTVTGDLLANPTIPATPVGGGAVNIGLSVNDKLAYVDLTITVKDAAGANQALNLATVIGGGLGGNWSLSNFVRNTDGSYTVRISNSKITRSGEAGFGVLTMWSAAYIDELIADAAKTVVPDSTQNVAANQIKASDAAVVVAKLTVVQTALADDDAYKFPTPATESTPAVSVDTISTNVDSAIDTLESAPAVIESTVTTEAEEYAADDVAAITEGTKAATDATAAKTAFDEAVAAAMADSEKTDDEKKTAMEEALATYKSAIDDALELDAAIKENTTAMEAYEATSITAVTGGKAKEQIEEAQTAFESAMKANDATTTTVGNALGTYKTAIDAALELNTKVVAAGTTASTYLSEEEAKVELPTTGEKKETYDNAIAQANAALDEALAAAENEDAINTAIDNYKTAVGAAITAATEE